ncbi:dTDP-4-dehydrorhamnose 3,5-epimerase family protein [Candidatus Woesebacteria bacterium]|nr:dTDP-4-dehydrorhamnose 3,5-epimerase family protein [Candidatus Woesebacteria bacterium]
MSLVENKRIDVAGINFDREPFIQRTSIEGFLLIRRPQYADGRGAFQEIARIPDISEALGREIVIRQTQRSRSMGHVLRGIHAEPQDKLITPYTGKMVAVIVDLDPKSPTFLSWLMLGFDNTEENCSKTTMFLREGLGNSMCVIGTDPVEYVYGVSKIYDPGTAGEGVRYNDPSLAIPWPISNPVVSNRDRNLPDLVRFLEQKTHG